MTYRFSDPECAGISGPTGEYIPAVPGNRDYDRLIAERITIEPYRPPLPSAPVVDALAFRRLFTPAERLAITEAGYTDPMVRMFMDDAAAAGALHLDHPDVTAGLAYMQSRGLLTAERVAAIKAGAPA
jgi:hypothetical protein